MPTLIIERDKGATEKSASLYDINSALFEALEAVTVDEETGEVVGAEAVRELQEMSAEKLTNIAKYIRQKQALVNEMNEHIKIVRDRMKTQEKTIEYLERLVVGGLETLKIKKIDAPDIRVSTRKSTSLEIFDKDQIPKEYMLEILTVKPDVAGMKAAIKAGKEIAGARLVENQNLSLK